MTSAFNTIRRQTAIDLLAEAWCTSDDQRLVQYLMSNTTLTVKVNKTFSPTFNYNLGAAQGDSLSGKLFTLNLAGGLNHVRAKLPTRPNPPIVENGMPVETGYADDVEYIDEDMEQLKEVYEVSKNVLEEWSLFVNDKTTFTRIYIADKDEMDEWGKPVRGNQPWKSEVLLGTKLGFKEDIANRCNKANTAFYSKYKKIWCNGPKRAQISEHRKLQLYEALVVSVLMYNSSCWAAPKHIMESINVLQRKHLRQILRIHWPNKISNEALYERCKKRPLTERAEKARWKMLGHILRSGNGTPEFQLFMFAVTGTSNLKGRRGRHRTNLFDTIINDLKSRGILVRDQNELDNLIDIARDRDMWREFSSEKN